MPKVLLLESGATATSLEPALVEVLRARGFEVAIARVREEAKATVERERADVVIVGPGVGPGIEHEAELAAWQAANAPGGLVRVSSWTALATLLGLSTARSEPETPKRLEASGARDAAPVPRPRSPSQPSSGRLLVVDGDPEFRRHVAELARRQLVEVVPAFPAAEALRVAAELPPDAALVDAQLADEGINAFDLVRRLRRLPGCERLPVAFASADAALDSRVGAAHAGASLFLAKPVDPDVFASAVQHLLARRSEGRPRVLLVDEDPALRSEVARLLGREGIVVEAARAPAEAVGALERFAPDLVLVDVLAGGGEAFDFCRAIRTSERWQDLPVVFVTSRQDLESRVRAFEAGADDYILRPVVPAELLARVRLRVERLRLLRERGERDPLSGLPLRRAVLEALRARLAESARHDRPLAIGLLDIDHFKRVNDQYGHDAGDRVIAGLGQLLQSRFRVEDVRGRWGGEEFIVGFPGETPATVGRVLARLLEDVAETEFVGDDGAPFRVTFTAGVAGYPADAASVDELIRVADRRLYLGKQRGRARVVDAD